MFIISDNKKQIDIFCRHFLIDPSLSAVYFSDDISIYYKRCLDTLRNNNLQLGPCNCSICTPKKVSSGFWFVCIGSVFYVVHYDFVDKYIKTASGSFFVANCENMCYMKSDFPCCVNFHIKNNSLISLNGFCQTFKLYLLNCFDLTKIAKFYSVTK